jgi:hypothetical protein
LQFINDLIFSIYILHQLIGSINFVFIYLSPTFLFRLNSSFQFSYVFLVFFLQIVKLNLHSASFWSVMANQSTKFVFFFVVEMHLACVKALKDFKIFLWKL